MNLYYTGLAAPASLGEITEPLRNHAGEVVAGVRMVKAGSPRMYLAGQDNKPNNLVEWFFDLVAGLLVVGGGLILASAFARGLAI